MESDPDNAGSNAFTPLERFTMELFRTINPNGGSISAMTEVRRRPIRRHGYVVTPTGRRASIPCTGKFPESSTLIATTACQRAIRSTRPSASRLALLNAPSTGQNSTSLMVGKPRSTIAASGPSMASSMASRYPFAIMPALRPSDLDIAAAPASS